MGRLRAELGARGLSVSTPDVHVAQCAIDTGGALLSEDRVFEKIARVVPLRLAQEPAGGGSAQRASRRYAPARS